MQLLNPGTLRHQISWQRRNVTSQNSTGEDVLGTPAYVTVVTCRAAVEPVTGREVALAMQRFPEARYVFRQHFYSGLSTDLRLSWYVDGQVKTLDVLDIQDESGNGRVLKVIAKDHGA